MTRHSPDLGGASDWLEVCFTDPTRSTTQIWVVTRHQYECLRSFLRLHVAGKSLVASPSVGFFLKVTFFSYKGSLKSTWLGGEGEPLYKDNFSTRKRGLTCVEERDLYHALPEWMPAFSQTGKRKTKTHVILIKSCLKLNKSGSKTILFTAGNCYSKQKK